MPCLEQRVVTHCDTLTPGYRFARAFVARSLVFLPVRETRRWWYCYACDLVPSRNIFLKFDACPLSTVYTELRSRDGAAVYCDFCEIDSTRRLNPFADLCHRTGLP